jgi:hypothetical protein
VLCCPYTARTGGWGPPPPHSSSVMAPLVGRRFLSVSGRTPLKLCKLYDWDWRAGWIRAATTTDVSDPELQVRAHTRLPQYSCSRAGEEGPCRAFFGLYVHSGGTTAFIHRCLAMITTGSYSRYGHSIYVRVHTVYIAICTVL